MHKPLAQQHRWYASILRGDYGYYGLPHNFRALNASIGRLAVSGSAAYAGAARRLENTRGLRSM